MERKIRHQLSKQELIIDDRVDVLPTHCLASVERGYKRSDDVQEDEE